MKAKIFVLLGFILIVAGCTTTSLIGSWIDPEVKSIEGKNIAIFCLTPRLDIRDKIETSLSESLTARGVNASRSLDFITPGKMEKEIIEEVLKSNGITSVILISLLDSQKETYYVPGSTAYVPYRGGYYGYYGMRYAAVYDPGYYQSTTSYFIECNAYRLSDEKLVYSSQTKTVDPSSLDKFAYDYTRLIISDLDKKGVLETGK